MTRGLTRGKTVAASSYTYTFNHADSAERVIASCAAATASKANNQASNGSNPPVIRVTLTRLPAAPTSFVQRQY